MALTISAVSGSAAPWGNKRRRDFDITFDDSYPDNGEALTAANFGFKKVESVIPHGPFRKSDGSNVILVSYDHTNSKLLAFRGKDPGDAGGADIPFPEVAATTDLSTYSGRVTVIGFG